MKFYSVFILLLISSSTAFSQNISKVLNDRVWQGEIDSAFRNNGIFVDKAFYMSGGDTLSRLMFFLPANRILLVPCDTKESVIEKFLMTNEIGRYSSSCLCWGNYEVNDGVITARIFERYMNKGLPRWIYKPTCYSGNLEGDSIVNWRLIPPYPKVLGFKDFDTTETRSFKFVSSELPAKIDANKAWLYNLKK